MGQSCEMGQDNQQGSIGYEQNWWEPSEWGRWQWPRALSASLPQIPIEMAPAPVIKAEPKEVNQFLNVPTGKKIEFPGQLYYSTTDCYTGQSCAYNVALGQRTTEEWALHCSNSDLFLHQKPHTELFRQGLPGKTGYFRVGNMQECL